MRNFATALLFAVLSASLPGCGQMGPLYMPPEEAPASAPEATGSNPEHVQQDA